MRKCGCETLQSDRRLVLHLDDDVCDCGVTMEVLLRTACQTWAVDCGLWLFFDTNDLVFVSHRNCLIAIPAHIGEHLFVEGAEVIELSLKMFGLA